MGELIVPATSESEQRASVTLESIISALSKASKNLAHSMADVQGTSINIDFLYQTPEEAADAMNALTNMGLKPKLISKGRGVMISGTFPREQIEAALSSYNWIHEKPPKDN